MPAEAAAAHPGPAPLPRSARRCTAAGECAPVCAAQGVPPACSRSFGPPPEISSPRQRPNPRRAHGRNSRIRIGRRQSYGSYRAAHPPARAPIPPGCRSQSPARRPPCAAPVPPVRDVCPAAPATVLPADGSKNSPPQKSPGRAPEWVHGARPARHTPLRLRGPRPCFCQILRHLPCRLLLIAASPGPAAPRPWPRPAGEAPQSGPVPAGSALGTGTGAKMHR